MRFDSTKLIFPGVLVLGVLSCLVLGNGHKVIAQQPVLAKGKSCMVSSAHPLATEAGISVLKQDGNAFDAAVAIAATLNVVEPGGPFRLLEPDPFSRARCRTINACHRRPQSLLEYQ